MIRNVLAYKLLLGFFMASATMAFGQKAQNSKTSSEFYRFELPGLTGQSIAMKDFAGKVVLVSNTASHCGYTKQYKGLQKLHETYHDKGLVVIGVPSNSFKQEFKDEKEVANFCEMNYGVKFKMAKILAVKGPDAHPVFRYLTENSSVGKQAAAKEIQWNFEKFLVDRKGQVRYRFASKTEPGSPEFIQAVKKLLSEK